LALEEGAAVNKGYGWIVQIADVEIMNERPGTKQIRFSLNMIDTAHENCILDIKISRIELAANPTRLKHLNFPKSSFLIVSCCVKQ